MILWKGKPAVSMDGQDNLYQTLDDEGMESDETIYEILTRLEAFKTKIHRSNTLTQAIRKVYFRAICCFDSVHWKYNTLRCGVSSENVGKSIVGLTICYVTIELNQSQKEAP
jgi:hypothetical protein